MSCLPRRILSVDRVLDKLFRLIYAIPSFSHPPFMMLASGLSSSRSPPRRHSLTPFPESSLSSAHESESVRPGASTDPPVPVLHRRHSLVLTRKPLRSSPLAGPALSSEEEEAVAIRRIRRSSTPNLPSLVRSDPPPPIPPLPTSSASKRLSKRASFIELVKRPLGQKHKPPPLPLVPSPYTTSPTSPGSAGSSFAHTPPSPPPPSPRRRSHARSPSSMTASMSSPDVSTVSIPPNFPRALTAPSSSRRTSTIPLPSPNIRDPSDTVYGVTAFRSGLLSDENWLAAMDYDTIPRFSRLSLATSNVVLPISARDARRKSYARSSLTQTDTASSKAPSLLRSRSRSISSEGPTTPSDSSVFDGDSVISTEDDDAPPHRSGVDFERPSPRDIDSVASTENTDGVVHSLKMTLAAAARSTWSLSLRRPRSSPHTPAPAESTGIGFVSMKSMDMSRSISRPMSVRSGAPTVSRPMSVRSRTPSSLASRPLSSATLLAPYTVVDSKGYNPYAAPAPTPCGSGRGAPGSVKGEEGSKKGGGTVRRMLHAFSAVTARRQKA
ncbi:hypothetical protein B0H16DRAFT_1562601 [Mycena metata]|uniref:Uncharacterized protein n=1 Tax=Mycena metata TaxID=1033252 RepID=A0AAD7N2G8_9AGAR|nr:hypothetical protein B0H16DRAFT_1562601 [Mycena metata]